MRAFLLILFFPAWAMAELPEQINDTPVMENQEFLLQEIRKESTTAKSKYAALAGTQTFTGSNTINSTFTVLGADFSVGVSSFVITDGLLYFPPYTYAQVNALKPKAVGGYLSCSNCNTPYIICKSSGTGVGAVIVSTGTAHCR
jgi:hypothetical protein